jgi:predicted DNA-binding transcriptional regulator YafY
MRAVDGTITAAALARDLEVSERTIYRDVAHLIGSGVPIDGEAGVGYLLRDRHELPPLTFTFEQLEALAFGARAAAILADEDLAHAANDALAKIEAVLPKEHADRLRAVPLYAVRPRGSGAIPAHLSTLRDAISRKVKTQIAYCSLSGEVTARTVRPLGLTNFGAIWLAICWCEMRNDFRNFRVDRIEGVKLLKEKFADEPGKTIDDYFDAPGREHERP